jgi:hypothetical protein
MYLHHSNVLTLWRYIIICFLNPFHAILAEIVNHSHRLNAQLNAQFLMHGQRKTGLWYTSHCTKTHHSKFLKYFFIFSCNASMYCIETPSAPSKSNLMCRCMKQFLVGMFRCIQRRTPFPSTQLQCHQISSKHHNWEESTRVS